MKNRMGIRSLIAFAPLLAPSLAVAAEPTAAEILKMHDAAHSNFKDLIVESKMIVREPGKTDGREATFTTKMLGEDKRLVRFSSPGDVKGMAMLTEGRDTMYVFLPGFNRVRRMGTHLKGQTFMGGDLTYEDMNEGTYTGMYEPKLAATEDASWVLELTLLPGKEAEFPKLKMWVDKGHHQSTKLEFYDAKGALARTQTRTGWKKDEGGDHFDPEKVLMVDHRRNGHSTEVQILKARVNTGIAEDEFNQRNLIRGN